MTKPKIINTDFRALCAELVNALETWCETWHPLAYTDPRISLRLIANRARAALAVEAVGPSDEELLRIAADALGYEWIDNCEVGAVEAYGTELVAYARTVLACYGSAPAQEVVGPTYREVLALRDELDTNGLGTVDLVAFARAVLARYGTTPRPIPVAERLPGAEDCDPSGQCWWFTPSEEKWTFWPLKWAGPECSYWLPAHALPIPTQENADG